MTFGDDADSLRATRSLDALGRHRARLKASWRTARPYQLAGSVLLGAGAALEFTAAVRHVGAVAPICGMVVVTVGFGCTVVAFRTRAAYLKSHPSDV